MSEITITKTKTYSNRLGDINFIVTNSFSGTKTISDALENIIIARFRKDNDIKIELNKTLEDANLQQ